MLDVDGGDHCDPGVAQFLDILPSFGVLAAGCVGVCELVDQDHLRMSCQHGRHVEFREGPAPIVDIVRRNELDAFKQVSGFPAAVGLDHGGYHVGAAFQSPVCLAEHRVRFADTGSRAEVDAQLAALGRVVNGTHVNIIPPMALFVTR